MLCALHVQHQNQASQMTQNYNLDKVKLLLLLPKATAFSSAAFHSSKRKIKM